ncbi:uncharacterized protein VTP21DRAFT_10555 [Calcarisporiella thermophila]|uniref:uncharacterized protein n=1 Tax=Calcarisporiella thermophila TaxID=911321 RepID=UPI0037435AC6
MLEISSHSQAQPWSSWSGRIRYCLAPQQELATTFFNSVLLGRKPIFATAFFSGTAFHIWLVYRCNIPWLTTLAIDLAAFEMLDGLVLTKDMKQKLWESFQETKWEKAYLPQYVPKFDDICDMLGEMCYRITETARRSLNLIVQLRKTNTSLYLPIVCFMSAEVAMIGYLIPLEALVFALAYTVLLIPMLSYYIRYTSLGRALLSDFKSALSIVQSEYHRVVHNTANKPDEKPTSSSLSTNTTEPIESEASPSASSAKTSDALPPEEKPEAKHIEESDEEPRRTTDEVLKSKEESNQTDWAFNAPLPTAEASADQDIHGELEASTTFDINEWETDFSELKSKQAQPTPTQSTSRGSDKEPC